MVRKFEHVEIIVMVMCPWVSYLVAEGMELSGILSILLNGIFLSHYAAPNLTPIARKVLKNGFASVSYLAETLVFIFLGMGLFSFDHPYQRMGGWLMTGAFVIINLARLTNVWLMSFLSNRHRSEHKEEKINCKFQVCSPILRPA